MKIVNMNLGVNIDDFSIVKNCNCGCCVCDGSEYALESDYEKSETEEVITECECDVKKLKKRK